MGLVCQDCGPHCLVDLETINELCAKHRKRLNLNELHEYVRDYEVWSAERLGELEAAVKNGEWTALGDIIRQLREESKFLGASEVVNQCDGITRLLAHDKADLPPTFEGLRKTIRDTVGLLRMLITKKPEQPVRRILIVDDEPDLVALLGNYLEGCGWRPRRASTAEEALEILKHEHIDAIVTDLIMPGMRGDAFAAAVRRASPFRIPIVLITGELIADPQAMQSRTWISAILTKPFKLDELTKTLHEAMAEVQPETVG